MAEWLYEEGIGEERAILVDDEGIVEARVRLGSEPRPGAVVAGRLARILIPGRRAIAEYEGGELLVEPLPRELTEGQALRLEIVREAIAEQGRAKLARGRVSREPERAGPTLREEIGDPRPHRPPGADRFEASGWSEMLEEAGTGEIAFPRGGLRMSLTPAMTLFDVDGTLPPAELAVAGAAAAARAIRRLGIGGSIGIDLPTLVSKAERQAAAAAVDAILPRPFERTAVNGFGFLQIVRRRERASLPELIQADPVGTAARQALRRAEWSQGAGKRVIEASPAVVARLDENPRWLAELGRRVGAPVALRADPALTTWASHVHVLPG